MLSFHREGYKIIVFTFLIVLSGILLSERLIELYWLQKGIQTTLLFFLIIVLQFFRNPKRVTEINDNQIIAPVDGKVVVVEEVEEPEYFKGKRLQISIFMSPINVHVTRYALNGTVLFTAGSLDPSLVLRNRRRAALYVMLVSPGPLREFIKPESWDRSDHGPMEYRRDLLDKCISFLA